MPVGGMVNHQVDNYPDPAVPGLIHESDKVAEITEGRIDRKVIRYVIAVVTVR
jgi:hypothetical protein